MKSKRKLLSAALMMMTAAFAMQGGYQPVQIFGFVKPAQHSGFARPALFSGFTMTVQAEDLMAGGEDDELLIEVPDMLEHLPDVPGDDGGNEAGDSTGSQPAQDVQADDDAPLIEAGPDTGSVSEGPELDAVLAAEQAAEEARKRLAEITGKEIPVLEKADPERIAQYLEELMKYEDPTGSDGELRIGRYLEETLKSFGYTIEDQNFHEGFLNEDYIDIPGVNILAERGADSDHRSDGILVLCAHYDSKTKPQEGDPLANDKSGAAVLLETARLAMTIPTDVDICFLFVSGEEDGGYGSSHFMKTLGESFRSRIIAVISLGPVGLEDEASYMLGVADAAGAEDDVRLEPARIMQELSYFDQAQYLLDFGEESPLTRSQEDQMNAQDGPADGQSMDGQSTDGQNVDGQNMDGQSMDSPDISAEDDMVGAPEGSVWDDMVGAPEGQLADPWRIVTMESGIGKVFMENGYAAVTLFQSVNGGPAWTDAEELTSELSSEAETENQSPQAEAGAESQSSQAEAETGNQSPQADTGAENKPLRADPQRLAQVADLIAEAAALYMQTGSYGTAG